MTFERVNLWTFRCTTVIWAHIGAIGALIYVSEVCVEMCHASKRQGRLLHPDEMLTSEACGSEADEITSAIPLDSQPSSAIRQLVPMKQLS